MENKKQKMAEMVKKILEVRSKQSIIEFLNYAVSDEFTTDEEIIESVFYVAVILSDEEIKETTLNLREWVQWAKLRKHYVIENSNKAIGNENIQIGRRRVIEEHNFS